MLRYDNTADDDLDYVRRVMAKVERMFGPGRRVFVGFSIGAQFGLIALNRTPRLFTDFVSASGTCIGTEGVTRADVSLVQFYGEEDERFPWEGGFSNNRLTRFLERRLPLLDPRAANSDPHSLERGFAEANGYSRRPVEKLVAGGIAYRKQYNPPGAKPIVVSYYVCGPGLGGHTYQGPAAPEVFSVNERFVAELGLMPA